MRFTLYYDGPLPSAANDARLKEKHNIREKLHSQLLQLFREHPALPKPTRERDWANWTSWEWPGLTFINKPFLAGTTKTVPTQLPVLEWQEDQAVAKIGHLHFVPLVRASLELVCELDLLFLRPGRPGLMERGSRYDIDNRLLTLFDALTLPRGNGEQYTIEHNTLNQASPIFCLLGDDDRITAINVRTDSLLAPAEGAKEYDVRLIIGVTLRASLATLANRALAE